VHLNHRSRAWLSGPVLRERSQGRARLSFPGRAAASGSAAVSALPLAWLCGGSFSRTTTPTSPASVPSGSAPCRRTAGGSSTWPTRWGRCPAGAGRYGSRRAPGEPRDARATAEVCGRSRGRGAEGSPPGSSSPTGLGTAAMQRAGGGSCCPVSSDLRLLQRGSMAGLGCVRQRWQGEPTVGCCHPALGAFWGWLGCLSPLGFPPARLCTLLLFAAGCPQRSLLL